MNKTEVSNKNRVFHLDPSGFTRCHMFYGVMPLLQSSTSKRNKRLLYLSWQTALDICQESSETTIRQEATQATGVSDQTMNGWISYIRELFYSVPQVEAIYVTIDENSVDVWLLIHRRDFALVGQLVDLEMKTLEKFATTKEPLFLFEFHVIYCSEANEHELMPRHALRLPR